MREVTLAPDAGVGRMGNPPLGEAQPPARVVRRALRQTLRFFNARKVKFHIATSACPSRKKGEWEAYSARSLHSSTERCNCLHRKCLWECGRYFFLRGSSAGLRYSIIHGPSPWNCTTVSPFTQT